jgi:PIN domain nuclease of toxin-antitoxin system
MILLLDTCTFLWLLTDAPQLSRRARQLFQDPSNEVYLSVVSAWEIAVKHALGRLPLPEPPDRFIPSRREAHGIASLELDEEAVLQIHRLGCSSARPSRRAPPS